MTKLKHTVQRTKGGICLWSFLPCEPGNKKERCTLCSVALAKGEMRYPRPECRTSDRHSKLPPALPCSHCQPISSTTSPPGYQQREKASARGASRTATASASASPAGPHRIALALARSPISAQASRRSDPPLRRGVAGRFRGQQFSPCCCCCESRDSIRALLPWRRPPEPRPRRAHCEG